MWSESCIDSFQRVRVCVLDPFWKSWHNCGKHKTHTVFDCCHVSKSSKHPEWELRQLINSVSVSGGYRGDNIPFPAFVSPVCVRVCMCLCAFTGYLQIWNDKDTTQILSRLLKCALHLPSWFCDNHFSSYFVKLTPQVLWFQRNFRVLVQPFFWLKSLQGTLLNGLILAPQTCVQPRVRGCLLWQRLGEGRGVRKSRRGGKRRLCAGKEGWQGQGTWSANLERIISHGNNGANCISQHSIRSEKSQPARAGCRRMAYIQTATPILKVYELCGMIGLTRECKIPHS